MPTRAETKTWRSLRRRKGRAATGCFLAEGRRLVSELLAWGGPVIAILHAEQSDEEIRNLMGYLMTPRQVEAPRAGS